MDRGRVFLIASCVTMMICGTLIFVAVLVARRLPEEKFILSMSDVVPIDKLSSEWCKEVEVTSDTNVNTYLLKSSAPRIAPDRREKYDLDFSLRFFSIYKRVLHYFLLPGSRVTLSACAREPGVFLYLFKNRRDMKHCLGNQRTPELWIDEDEEDVHGKFRDYVQDRKKERLDNARYELDHIRDRLIRARDGLDNIKEKVKDRLGDNKEEFAERMGKVHKRLDYVKDRLHDKENGQQVVSGIGDEVQDRIDTRQDRMDKIKGGVNGRIDGVRDKLMGKDDDQQVVASIGDQIQDRIDTRQDRMNNMNAKVDVRIDGTQNKTNEKIDEVHAKIDNRMDKVSEGVDGGNVNIMGKIGDTLIADNKMEKPHDTFESEHDKIHRRLKESLDWLDKRRGRNREHLDKVEDRVNNKLDNVREGIDNRLDIVNNTADGLNEVKDHVKDRLDKVKDHLDDIRGKLDKLKPFRRDCSSAMATVEVPVLHDGLRCSSNNSVTLNITEIGNFFIVLENFYHYGVNKVDLRIRLDRSVYDLPEDSKVCSNTKKCTVPLLFKSQQQPMVQMAAPSTSRQNDDEDLSDTAKVVTVCKARVSFFLILFAAVPVAILIGIAFCLGALCTCRKKSRGYTYIERLSSENDAKVPLLKHHTVTYSTDDGKHLIPSAGDRTAPPPYSTAPPSATKPAAP